MMVIGAGIFLSILIFGTLVFSTVNAQGKYDIPSWVKGVAGFWAEDKITDDDFGDGLSFLIEEDIIKVPKIESLIQQVAQLEAKVNQLEQENVQFQSQLKSSTSNLDIIVEKDSKSILSYKIGNLSIKGVTRYFGTEGSTDTIGSADLIIPTSGTISDLIVKTTSSTNEGGDQSPGIGESIQFTLMKNNIDTELSCTIVDTETTCMDSSHSVSVDKADRIVIKVTNNADLPQIFVHISTVFTT